MFGFFKTGKKTVQGPPAPSVWYTQAVAQLAEVKHVLGIASNAETVMNIVRDAARGITEADGATFVLRDGEQCYYAEENAIMPLWKGKRFPIHACISGWVMMHSKPAVIPDIYEDARIPIDAYEPTFVKSLVMVPIGHDAPIGAIGNYWATRRQPTPEELEILQALADATFVALERTGLEEDNVIWMERKAS